MSLSFLESLNLSRLVSSLVTGDTLPKHPWFLLGSHLQVRCRTSYRTVTDDRDLGDSITQKSSNRVFTSMRNCMLPQC